MNPGVRLDELHVLLEKRWNFVDENLLEVLGNAELPIVSLRNRWFAASDDTRSKNELVTDSHQTLLDTAFLSVTELVEALTAKGWEGLTNEFLQGTLEDEDDSFGTCDLFWVVDPQNSRDRLASASQEDEDDDIMIVDMTEAAEVERELEKELLVEFNRPDYAMATGTRERTHSASSVQTEVKQSRPNYAAATRTRERVRPAASAAMGNQAIRFWRDNELEQGTREWHEWRRSVIGASEAPTIMNASSLGMQRLLEEKLGRRSGFTGNAATLEGHLLEPRARQAASQKIGITFGPAIAQSASHLFLAASLDGIDAKSTQLLEIKCGAKSYADVAATGRIPNHYFGQLQHQLMITQLEFLHYVAYRPDRPLIVIQVSRDNAYIERLLEAELRFVARLRGEGHKLRDLPRGSAVRT